MSQNTGLLIFFVVLAVIFVIAVLAVIMGVVRRSKMGHPVTHDTYGNNLDNANLSGSNGTNLGPQRLGEQDSMHTHDSPMGTGTNKSGNVPESYRQ